MSDEVQVTLSYEALESMAMGKPLEVDVDDLDLRLTLSVNPLAMRVMRAQMAAIRLLYLPTPKTEH